MSREQDFSFCMVPLKRITVRDRSRQDMGDLDGLTLSIKELGLLNPITVTSDFHLVAGQRRLEACRRLGWDEVPAHVVHHFAADSVIAVLAEVAENDKRKGLTTSERNIATARRMTLAAKLREEGHSLRSIGETLGVDAKTVRNDLARGDVSPPEFVTGADGKTYPATQVSTPTHLDEIVPGGADDSDAPGLARVEPLPQDEASTPPGTTIDPETGEILVHDEPAPAWFDANAALNPYLDTAALRVNNIHKRVLGAINVAIEDVIKIDPEELMANADPDLLWFLEQFEASISAWFTKFNAARPRRLTAVK